MDVCFFVFFFQKYNLVENNKDRNSNDYTCKFFFKKIEHNLLTILLYHVTITNVNEKHKTKYRLQFLKMKRYKYE
jgi:hypothetical protein